MNTILADIQKDMDDFFAEMDKAIGRVPEKKVKKVEEKAWLVLHFIRILRYEK